MILRGLISGECQIEHDTVVPRKIMTKSVVVIVVKCVITEESLEIANFSQLNHKSGVNNFADRVNNNLCNLQCRETQNALLK